MSKKLLVKNQLIGFIIFLVYFTTILLHTQIFSLFFQNRIIFADSWWYWPFKYVYDTTKYWFYPPDPVIVPETIPDKLKGPIFEIPYIKMNDVEIPLTEHEIAQIFFNRLIDDGTWIYFILFIVYYFFNSLFFWGCYLFLKLNIRQLLSFQVFNVLKIKFKKVYIIYILSFLLLQLLLFELDPWDTYHSECYYGMTTVLFFFFADFTAGNIAVYNPLGIHFPGREKENAFWFFKGQHIEFCSMICAFLFLITFFLDFFDLLPMVE